MIYMPFDEKMLLQVSDETEISENAKERLLSSFRSKDFKTLVHLLEKQRLISLSKIRESEKQLDHLDFILYQVKKLIEDDTEKDTEPHHSVL